MDTIDRPPQAPGTEDRFVDEAAAAYFLGLTRGYLRQLRVAGGGPRFARLGVKAIRYKKSELSDWAERRVVASTSDKRVADE